MSTKDRPRSFMSGLDRCTGSATDLATLLGVEVGRVMQVLQETGGNVERSASRLMDEGDGPPTSVAKDNGTTDPSTWSIMRLRETLRFAGVDTTGCMDKADLVALVTSHGLHCQEEAMAVCGSTQREATKPLAITPATEPEPETDKAVDDCPICQEAISPAQAAMRCTGGPSRLHHYFHAECLAQWIRNVRAKGDCPSCPMCRGPLQVNSRRLGDFLDQKGSALGADDSEVLQSLYNNTHQRRGPAAPASSSSSGRRAFSHSQSELEWEEPNWETALASVAAAGAIIGFGALLYAGWRAIRHVTRNNSSR